MANILLIEEVATLPQAWLTHLGSSGHALFRFEQGDAQPRIDMVIAWVNDPSKLKKLLDANDQAIILAVIDDAADPVAWGVTEVDDLLLASASRSLFHKRIELLLRLHEQQMALKEAQAQLSRLTVTDSSTGIFNRAHFLSLAHKELSRALRFSVPFSLIMIDVDQFKELTARHGEEVANLILVRFAEICQAEVRQVDIIGRLSGSEFGVCCPETSLAGAKIIAERIRAAVARSMLHAGGELVKFTVSGGLATLEELEMDLGAVLTRADRALTQAQTLGGNRMVAGLRKTAP